MESITLSNGVEMPVLGYGVYQVTKEDCERGVIVIPKSTHKERMEENFNVFDFALTDDDMTAIASLDRQKSAFFSHQDPAMVEWFVRMVEKRKKQHDCAKEKKNW